MKRKNDNISAVITVTVVATVAVLAAIASFGYIIYDKFVRLKSVSYDPDIDGDGFFEESADRLETMIVGDDDVVEF